VQYLFRQPNKECYYPGGQYMQCVAVFGLLVILHLVFSHTARICGRQWSDLGPA